MHKITLKIKRDIIAFWLTHDYLRRIGKHYPEHFNKMINDLTDNKNCRKVMFLRYTGEPLKFEAIAFEMNMADIQKDISESFKNLIKVHVMTSEHSVEKY